jgi:uncharacterized protein (DUF849 family)
MLLEIEKYDRRRGCKLVQLFSVSNAEDQMSNWMWAGKTGFMQNSDELYVWQVSSLGSPEANTNCVAKLLGYHTRVFVDLQSNLAQ